MPMSENPANEKPVFIETQKIDEAVIAILDGHSLAGTRKDGNKAIFVFKGSRDKYNKTISQFYTGQLRQDPAQVFRLWKNLRTLTFAVTGNIR